MKRNTCNPVWKQFGYSICLEIYFIRLETLLITQTSNFLSEIQFLYFDISFDILSGLKIVLFDWRHSLSPNARNIETKYIIFILITSLIFYLDWKLFYWIGDVPYWPTLKILSRNTIPLHWYQPLYLIWSEIGFIRLEIFLITQTLTFGSEVISCTFIPVPIFRLVWNLAYLFGDIPYQPNHKLLKRYIFP